jgi:MFS family permease
LTSESPKAFAFIGRNLAFLRYQIARFFAVMGWQIQSVAIGWLVYDRTRDPLALGMVGLAQFIPLLALAGVGGLVADRFSRIRILRISHVALCLNSLAFAWLTTRVDFGPWPMYLGLALLGVIRAFTGPASQALVPTLVSKEDFPRAIASSSVILNLATLAGPSLGGMLYAYFEGKHMPHHVFTVCGVLFSLALLLLSTLPKTVQLLSTEGKSFAAILLGLRYVLRNRTLLGAICLDLFAVLLGGAVALLPVFARDILHAGPRELGYLRSAGAVGAVVVALWLTAFPLKKHAGLVMFAAVIVFGLATIAFGLSRNIAVSILALFLVGASDMLSVQVRHTLVQLRTPDEMRGRVSAVNMVFITASNEFGEFESGFTAKAFGAVPAVVIGGILSCVVVTLCFFLFPELRKFQGSETGDAPAP